MAMRSCGLVVLLAGSASAFRAAAPLWQRASPASAATLQPAVAAVTQRVPSGPVAVMGTDDLSTTALLALDVPLQDVFGGAAQVGAAFVLLLFVLAGLAGTGGFEAGAALMLLLFQGDPEEREKSGANDSGALIKFAMAVTPSAWKKAYLGDNDVERADGEEPPKLDLPAWQGEEAPALVEPEAVTCVKQMQLMPLEVPSVGAVDTCYVSLPPTGTPADAPPLMLIHGFDSSVLEFRYITDALTGAGLRVEAMEWWTGGFTDRTPFERAIREGEAQPWDLIREHQFAFWKKQLDGQKVVLLGASLGGAVALDFAATHPECVAGLILMDAGGESYAQPNPTLTSLAADPVTNLFQWRATNGLLPYPHLWAKMDGWRDALRAYLKSGGYQNRVGPELIRTVPQPTVVLWGEEDDVLPVEDAYKYEKDLPNCVGVTLIPDAQHAPALENPPFVAEQIIKFAKSKVWEKVPAAA